MPVRAPRSRRAGVFAVALLAGCASAPQGEKTVLSNRSTETLVILPLNVTAVMPRELEPHGDRIWRQLEVYLEAHDAELKTVAFPAARRMWLASLREARAASGEKRIGLATARIFTAKLAEHAAFQAVILPSLFLRKADITAKTAAWDGVVRELEVETRGGTSDLERPPIYGAAPAASLHVLVLDAQGERVQEAIGGLELLVRVRLSPAEIETGGNPKFIERDEVFTSREAVFEGIALALAPFLPRLTPEEVETRLERRPSRGAP